MTEEAGGFEPEASHANALGQLEGLLSPAPSAVSAAGTNPSGSVLGLPHPRTHPLRPGSTKEDRLRQYVEGRMLYISRRYVKKLGLQEPGDEVLGYQSAAQLCKDVDGLVNIIWLTGTPNLQVPGLLNIASELVTWLPSFRPPSPAATLSLLRKLDHCFASLLLGRDLVTKEDLPGFENGPRRAGMTPTDMIRCKSLVEQTRVLAVDIVNSQNLGAEDGGEEDDDDDDDEDEGLHMDVARVYQNTLVQLGEALGEGAGVGNIQISDD